ncbi:MAG: histidine kinase [Saprospiraceae bacterium]|nr:histidine kinase [Saprospiraceae bacterium]
MWKMEQKKYWILQVILHLLVFAFYVVDRNMESIPNYKYAFFANYALTAFLINYFVLSAFYKHKQLWRFLLSFCALIFVSVMIEELILERIFFEGQRADSIQIVWAFISIVPVVTILTGFKFGLDAFAKQREVERLNALVRESELQFLKSQINPHFLFNNLNNLYSYALEASDKTPTIILELSSILRYMLYECQDEYVPLKKEIEQLENFINLGQLQIENRGVVKFNSDMAGKGFLIAPMLLMVFVENAFKHSQTNQADNIVIDINLNCDPSGALHFACKNNFETEGHLSQINSGVGLENVKKRLEMQYPQMYDLKIHSSDKFYHVDLRLQLSRK